MKQLRIPAVYMRGGTSKGVFFHAHDLPTQPSERDQILLRIMGSPDPYGKQIDGMGGASSSTSKVVIIAKSTRPNCDVDYLFGQVSITNAVIDWSGNGVADLISGQITMSFGTAPGLIPHIKNGKMIPIAVSSAARIPALPQVPSIAELIPGYDLSNWFGIFSPGQTSKPVVDKLFQSISKALASPDISGRLTQDGFDSIGLSPDKFDKSFREELAFWQKFVKENNIKIE